MTVIDDGLDLRDKTIRFSILHNPESVWKTTHLARFDNDGNLSLATRNTTEIVYIGDV